MRLRWLIPILCALAACHEPLFVIPAVDEEDAGVISGDQGQGEANGEGEGEADGGTAEGGEGEGEAIGEGEGEAIGEGEGGGAEGEGEDGEDGEGGEGEPDLCAGIVNDFVNGGLHDGALGWGLLDAWAATENGNDFVEFERPALCASRPALTQSVFVPEPCGDRGPALFVVTSIVSHAPYAADADVHDRIGQVLPLVFADGRRVRAASARRCLGDAQLGRLVEFRFSGAIYPTEATDCLSDPFAQVRVRRAELSLEACPVPGTTRPFSAWRLAGSENTATVRPDGTLELRTLSACETALVVGPNGGTASVPSAFQHPALRVRGHKAASQPRSFTVEVDGLSIRSVDAFDDLVVCLPDEVRGRVVDVRLSLNRTLGFCSQPNPQLAVVEALDLIDEPSCTGEIPEPASWSGSSIIDEDDEGVVVAATSCPNLIETETFAQAPPVGAQVALRIRYAADRDVDVYVSTFGADFLPSTDGDVVEVTRCIDMRAAGQAFSIRLLPRMRFSNNGGPGDECAYASARFESISIVEDVTCPPLF